MIPLILLGLIGAAVAVHAICIATDIPDKVPLSFGLEAATMFAAGIAGSVFAFQKDLTNSSLSLLFAVVIQLLYLFDAWRLGYKINGLVVTEYKPGQVSGRRHLHIH